MADEATTQGTTGGAATNAEPAKTFAQADVDRIVSERLAKERAKYGDVDSIRAQAAKAAEYEAELAKIREEQELAGKTEAEKQKARQEAAEKRFRLDLEARDKSIAELTAKHTAAEQRLRQTVIGHQATSALVEAKVFPASMSDALAIFTSAADIETDDAHKVTAITVDGVRHSTLKEAAEAFLKARPYFAAASIGSGSGGRSGVASTPGKPVSDRSIDELKRLALRPRN